MKLDPNCVRDILLEIEKLDFYETTNPDKLHNALPGYSVEQLTYTCLKLGEGGFLTLSTFGGGDIQPSIKCVVGLTYKGHEFLENIRDDKNWTDIKSVAAKIGAKSLDAVFQIASNVVASLIKGAFWSAIKRSGNMQQILPHVL